MGGTNASRLEYDRGVFLVPSSGMVGGPITAADPANDLGKRSEFITSNGVACWGFPVRGFCVRYGYLESAGGDSIDPQIRFDVQTNQPSGIGVTYNIGGGFPRTRAILINEDALTEEILAQPYINEGSYRYYVVGIYGTF
jgi:hypothetical protein